MIRRTINHMKTRPHHERRALALMIAMGVIVVLFLCWAFFFFADIHADNSQINTADGTATTTPQ